MSTFSSEELARQGRILTLRLAHQAKASHVGGALSVMDMLAVLYSHINVRPKEPHWSERDRLFYSKGHACLALYSILQLKDFFKLEELETFTSNGSPFTSHVSHKVPGVELSTGSLGHALGVACGVAVAGKLKNKAWRTYCILSDGELDEGSNWEAILFAAHHQLSNLTILIDYNKIQSFGRTAEVLNIDPLKEKFQAFGWATVEVNGHDHEGLRDALRTPAKDQRPLAMICHTTKGKGVSFMEDQLLWHYRSPSDQDLQTGLAELGVPTK